MYSKWVLIVLFTAASKFDVDLILCDISKIDNSF